MRIRIRSGSPLIEYGLKVEALLMLATNSTVLAELSFFQVIANAYQT